MLEDIKARYSISTQESTVPLIMVCIGEAIKGGERSYGVIGYQLAGASDQNPPSTTHYALAHFLAVTPPKSRKGRNLTKS
jgi:hypothetical protein